MDIHIHFDMKRYKHVMQLSYMSDKGYKSKQLDLDGNAPYPYVRLDNEQVNSLIEFLKESLVSE